ncbi:MAG: polyketide synthase, partial [Planctomycetota bacterium]
MTKQPPTTNALPDAGKIAAALKQAKAKLREARERQSEPLAVVSVGCRFPGSASSAAYWRLLQSKAIGIVPTPVDRWDADVYSADEAKQPGKITSALAGFLDRVDTFDPQFFGISSREAASLDPQHRLLFEVAWETLEQAAINPDRLRGKRAGVFVGLCSNDYLHLLCERDQQQIDAYLGTGNAHSSAAGRLSYFLDWRGPAIAVDTACSSSLTAIHYAAQSIRAGECDLALAGGVNLMLTPELSINLSQASMLSPLGVSRAFCRGGDGFVRGEGCGLVLLKRLSHAVADGDRVLCVLRGTAVNQDGRSNGLTAPNGPAQQAVIRQALAASGLQPEAIDYVEAHGTGTELGDPTEMGALAGVFAKDRAQPLRVGTAKTNIGHLEGAAGVAGFIKTCLSLYHEELPPHPLLEPESDGPNGPSPHIDWTQPIEVPTERTPW